MTELDKSSAPHAPVDPLSAPLEWRIAAGHRLVELDWDEADLVDIWVMNIWKEYGDLPPVEAVNKWYAPHQEAAAKIEAGTHPYISKCNAWGKEFELAWGELVFGEYDWESTLLDAYRIYKTEGHRSPQVVAREYFDAMDEDIKSRYTGRQRSPKAIWIPPTI